MTSQGGPPVDEDDTRDQHWHVTRGIPVAFIITMVVMFVTQTATAAWYASSMSFRVEAVERAQIQAAPQGERLTRVEEKLVAVNTGIADIKALLQNPVKPQR